MTAAEEPPSPTTALPKQKGDFVTQNNSLFKFPLTCVCLIPPALILVTLM